MKSKAEAKAETKASSDAAKPAKASKVSASKPVVAMDVVIHSPKLSIGASSNPRLELCAVDSNNNRVYIYGATKRAYGDDMEVHGHAIKKFIEDNEGVTKARVLAFKASLRKS